MTQQASRPAVCTAADATVQQATQEARGMAPRQWSRQQEENMVVVKKRSPSEQSPTEKNTDKGKTPAAAKAHVDTHPTVAPGTAAAKALATPAAVTPAPVATATAPADQAAQPTRRKRAPRPKRTPVQKRLVSLVSISKRLDVAIAKVKPLEAYVTGETVFTGLTDKLVQAKALVIQVRDQVAAIPADWKPAKPAGGTKKAAEVFLTEGAKLVIREAFSDKYGDAAKGVLVFVANRRGLVEVTGPRGPVFIPRGHLIPAVSTVAQKEAASS